jgi:hypothetical protein
MGITLGTGQDIRIQVPSILPSGRTACFSSSDLEGFQDVFLDFDLVGADFEVSDSYGHSRSTSMGHRQETLVSKQSGRRNMVDLERKFSFPNSSTSIQPSNSIFQNIYISLNCKTVKTTPLSSWPYISLGLWSSMERKVIESNRIPACSEPLMLLRGKLRK